MRILGNLFAIPSMLLFYATWILAMLFRPLSVATLLAALIFPRAAWRKMQLIATTVLYMVLCNDKKYKKKPDAALAFASVDSTTVEKKTVVFVRHGESTWNDTFNRGDRSKFAFITGFLPNLITAVMTEWYFWLAGKSNESWFYDAPLSEKGRKQAESVCQFLRADFSFATPKEADMIKRLRGEHAESSTQLVSSNLRRAIATMALGFQDRLQNAKPKEDSILILPSLQEMSRNPDALTITPAHGTVLPAFSDPDVVAQIYQEQVDTSMHKGNKPLFEKGVTRLDSFCETVFTLDKDTIIAGGHSLWFRSFFQAYLPHSSPHVSKKKKLVNGGVVSFTLQQIPGTANFMIDPASIMVLHGGF